MQPKDWGKFRRGGDARWSSRLWDEIKIRKYISYNVAETFPPACLNDQRHFEKVAQISLPKGEFVQRGI